MHRHGTQRNPITLVPEHRGWMIGMDVKPLVVTDSFWAIGVTFSVQSTQAQPTILKTREWAVSGPPDMGHPHSPADLKSTLTLDTESGVCPAGFQSCFGTASPRYAPFPVFQNANVCPVLLYA